LVQPGEGDIFFKSSVGVSRIEPSAEFIGKKGTLRGSVIKTGFSLP
jgi:hypothetical protein